MRFTLRVLSTGAALFIAPVASAQESACVTVRDDVTHHAIASALVRIDLPAGAALHAWSDAAGRACWVQPLPPGARNLEADAVGYRHLRRDGRAGDTLALSRHRAGATKADDAGSGDGEWGREQLAVAVALAVRELGGCSRLAYASCATSQTAAVTTPRELSLADSAASAEARARLAKVSLPWLERILVRLRNGTGPAPLVVMVASVTTLSAFVDVPDSSERYTELRLAVPSNSGQALFGATEMVCSGTECARQRQVSFRWMMNDDRTLAPALAMSTDAGGATVDVFDLTRLASSPGAPAREAVGRTLTVGGVVRDDKDRAVGGAQILASPGDGETRADSTGSFLLVVHTNASAVLLTARALGHTPVFRTALVHGDTAVRWEPRLRAVQLLSARVVTGKGVPAQLGSWRYDELMARRASGRGFFMVGNEISSSSSIGDALARAPGLNVKMKYSNTIISIAMSRCTRRRISEKYIAPDARIGVWVNGIERTASQAAENVLGDLLVAEVIAMEVYNGASEIPAEYTGANYCGVVSVWTK